MDSVPQELINEIINNLPYSSLPSSSLISRRWQQRSQQRAFDYISFTSESKVDGWHRNIRAEISTYVRSATFHGLGSWEEPALCYSVLRNFSSLATLWMYGTEIPHGLPGCISRGEFGERLTTLALLSPRCTLSTIVSMSLSPPNLKKLIIGNYGFEFREPPSTYPVTLRPLNSIKLFDDVNEVTGVLAECQFTSRNLCIDMRGIQITNIQRLLALSSEIIVELTLNDTPDEATAPPIHLPSFPALTSIHIDFHFGRPSPRLTTLLSSISSAPMLASVDVGHEQWDIINSVPPDEWAGLDAWLARVAKKTTVEGGLVLVLKRWPPGMLVWQGFLPEFGKAGGKIETDPFGWLSMLSGLLD